MNLNQLQYVLQVAKNKSFSLAAEDLFISQSTLSQQIMNLENELGTKLFVRTTRDVRITDAGRAFVQEAAEILRRTEGLRQSMSDYAGLLKGTLNIGAINALETIHFSQIITDFYSAFPQLTVNIVGNSSYPLLDALENRSLDIAFLTRPVKGSWPTLQFDSVGVDHYCLLVAKKHPLADRKTVALQELKEDRFILHQPTQAVSDICLAACEEAGFSPNIVCRNSAAPISANLVRAGLGVGFFTMEESEGFLGPDLARLTLKKPIRKEIVMVTPRTHEPSRLVGVFIDFVMHWLAAQDGD
ncbi:MAG: LysR family transcriptional regulator [Lachnospiraceae bacterium]|nr:LysR family transcriptional regulator [Lachnospiraceae bacterium]